MPPKQAEPIAACKTKAACTALDVATFDSLPDAIVLDILLLMPLDARLRVGALLLRRCARLLRSKDAWRVISFDGCDAPVNDRTLLLLCARAGPALRCLDLSGCDAYRVRVSVPGLLDALGGPAGLNVEQLFTLSADDERRALCHFSELQAPVLRAACPQLRDGSFSLVLESVSPHSTFSALRSLPGRVYLDTKSQSQAVDCYASLVTCLAAREDTQEGDHTTLVGLQLHGGILNQAGADALKHLLQCAPRGGPLRLLKLELNAISDARGAFAALAPALLGLDALELEVKHAGKEAQAVAALLSDAACSLSRLQLSGCNLGSDGVEHLAAALAVNTTLTELHLLDSSFADKEVSALARACTQSLTLKTVLCRGGRISAPMRETLTLFAAMKSPRQLRWDWVYECKVQNSEVRA